MERQFQSHLYGIESFLGFCARARAVRFNRTFMELKVLRFRARDGRIFGFNRTFMELKVDLRCRAACWP